jgi:hypothetical protein
MEGRFADKLPELGSESRARNRQMVRKGINGPWLMQMAMEQRKGPANLLIPDRRKPSSFSYVGVLID